MIMATNNAGNMYVGIGAAKQITMPAQPTFLVYNDAAVNTVTGDGTTYTCVWPVELTDIGGNFSGNTFTAPVAGKYLLNTTFLLSGIGAGHTEAITYIVTTAQTFQSYINAATACSSSGSLTTKLGVICSMSAGDTAIVQIKVSNSTKTVNFYGLASPSINSYFSGSLIA
jgi:hypothetical protein